MASLKIVSSPAAGEVSLCVEPVEDLDAPPAPLSALSELALHGAVSVGLSTDGSDPFVGLGQDVGLHCVGPSTVPVALGPSVEDTNPAPMTPGAPDPCDVVPALIVSSDDSGRATPIRAKPLLVYSRHRRRPVSLVSLGDAISPPSWSTSAKMGSHSFISMISKPVDSLLPQPVLHKRRKEYLWARFLGAVGGGRCGSMFARSLAL